MKRTFLVIFIAVMFLLPVTYALTPEERVFFQQEYQKMQASYESKIDTQVNRVEQLVKSEVTSAKDQIREEMSQEIKGKLMVVAVGLGGVMLVILAVFKVVEIKLDYTRRIKKYEDKLKGQVRTLDALIEQNKKRKEMLDRYRDQLVETVRKRRMDSVQAGQVPQEIKESPKKTFFKFRKLKDLLKKYKKGMKIILIIFSIGIIIFIAFRMGWIPEVSFNQSPNLTTNLT